MSDERRVYETVGEMSAVYSVGTVRVVECPDCYALVLWYRTDAHDEWRQSGSTEGFMEVYVLGGRWHCAKCRKEMIAPPKLSAAKRDIAAADKLFSELEKALPTTTQEDAA